MLACAPALFDPPRRTKNDNFFLLACVISCVPAGGCTLLRGKQCSQNPKPEETPAYLYFYFKNGYISFS